MQELGRRRRRRAGRGPRQQHHLGVSTGPASASDTRSDHPQVDGRTASGLAGEDGRRQASPPAAGGGRGGSPARRQDCCHQLARWRREPAHSGKRSTRRNRQLERRGTAVSRLSIETTPDCARQMQSRFYQFLRRMPFGGSAMQSTGVFFNTSSARVPGPCEHQADQAPVDMIARDPKAIPRCVRRRGRSFPRLRGLERIDDLDTARAAASASAQRGRRFYLGWPRCCRRVA